MRTAESWIDAVMDCSDADDVDGVERLIAAIQADAVSAAEAEAGSFRAALALIACPARADGTYNRCRESCEILARETLEAHP